MYTKDLMRYGHLLRIIGTNAGSRMVVASFTAPKILPHAPLNSCRIPPQCTVWYFSVYLRVPRFSNPLPHSRSATMNPKATPNPKFKLTARGIEEATARGVCFITPSGRCLLGAIGLRVCPRIDALCASSYTPDLRGDERKSQTLELYAGGGKTGAARRAIWR